MSIAAPLMRMEHAKLTCYCLPEPLCTAFAGDEVRAGFAVNNVDVKAEVVDALVAAMDSDGGDRIGFDAFASCMYALSIQSRKVRAPAKYAVFPDSAVESATGSFRVRRLIWKLLEDPSSSPLARTIAVLLSLVVLLSVSSFLAESYPEVRAGRESAFLAIECACVVVFTIEYVLRLACTPEVWRFLFSFFNVVDLLAIAPFYIDLIAGGEGSGSGAPLLRAVRLVRVLRLMKLGRYVAWMRIFGATLEKSAAPLGMLAFVTATMIVLWSSIVYFAERGSWDAATSTWMTSDGTPSYFVSIPASFWWATVTMTTVGYGDAVPLTGIGRTLAMCAIITGLTLLAIPISIVTSNLHAEYDRMDKLKALRAAHEAQPPPAPLLLAAAAAAAGGAVPASGRHALVPAPAGGLQGATPVAPAGTGIAGRRSSLTGGVGGVGVFGGSGAGTARSAAGGGGTGSGTGTGRHFDGVHMVSEDDPHMRIARQSMADIAAETSAGAAALVAGEAASGLASVTGLSLTSTAAGASADAFHADDWGPAAAAPAIAGTPGRRADAALPLEGAASAAAASAAGPEGVAPKVPVAVARAHSSIADYAPREGALQVSAKPAVLPHHAVPPGSIDVPLPASAPEDRMDAAWSEPFLRSALQVVRGNRRRLMSSIKQLELHNREKAVEDTTDLIYSLSEPDRVKALLTSIGRAGLA